jgi:hypothetical protein
MEMLNYLSILLELEIKTCTASEEIKRVLAQILAKDSDFTTEQPMINL